MNGEMFWEVDRAYRTALAADVRRVLGADSLLSERIDSLLNGITDHDTYKAGITDLNGLLATGFASASILYDGVDVSPPIRRGVTVQQPGGNPWNFEYTRWYSDTVELFSKRFSQEFYPNEDVLCFLTNSGTSAFRLAVDVLDDYLFDSGLKPYWFVLPLVYGECKDIVINHCRNERLVLGSLDGLTGLPVDSLLPDAIPIFLIDLDDVDQFKYQVSKIKNIFGERVVLIIDVTRYPDFLAEDFYEACGVGSESLVIRFQSLTKYFYAGLATGRGGVLTLSRSFCEELKGRAHGYPGKKAILYRRALLGCIPEPFDCWKIPDFSRQYITKKIGKHIENSIILQDELSGAQIYHTILSYDPECDEITSQRIIRQGPGVFVSLPDGTSLKAMTEAIIDDLSLLGICVQERGSFGFANTTYDVWGEKTIRISTGTEDRILMEEICRVTLENLLRFS